VDLDGFVKIMGQAMKKKHETMTARNLLVAIDPYDQLISASSFCLSHYRGEKNHVVPVLGGPFGVNIQPYQLFGKAIFWTHVKTRSFDL
jgi:hypothetical protein